MSSSKEEKIIVFVVVFISLKIYVVKLLGNAQYWVVIVYIFNTL